MNIHEAEKRARVRKSLRSECVCAQMSRDYLALLSAYREAIEALEKVASYRLESTMPADQIADPKLRELWRTAAKTLDEIDALLGTDE